MTMQTSLLAPDLRLTVCGLDELGGHCAAGVTHVLSILDPGFPEPVAFKAYDPHHRLTLHFHDIITPWPGWLAPEREHIEALVVFGEELDTAGEALRHLLVHCHAGISRSTASMATLLAEARPEWDEDFIFAHIREIRPQAWPNSRMIAMADELLGRGGRLTAALRRHYREQMERRPDLAEMIERVGRAEELRMAA